MSRLSSVPCGLVALQSVAVVTFAFSTCARLATAAAQDPDPPSVMSEARRALTEANTALAATPARSVGARLALERAIAAGADSLARAEAYFRLGVLDENDGAFARALANYSACIAVMPTSRWAGIARKRVAWLGERSEGRFTPLAHLQRVKRDPALANDPAAIEALASDAETFPRGMVRGEARMLVAETWLRQMNRSKDAVDELRKVLDDPNADRRTAVFAERDLVDVWLAGGKLDDAASEVQRHPFDPQLATEIQRLVHNRTLQRCGIVAIVMLVGLALVVVAGVHCRRRALTAGTIPAASGSPRSTRV